MHRAQRIQRDKLSKPVQIIDKRQPNLVPQEINETPNRDLPLRTVVLMEVGDTEPAKVHALLKQINSEYDNARGGIHYILPIRHGKIGSDIIFEQEFLSIVHKVCEVKDGEIILKDGAKECQIVREYI